MDGCSCDCKDLLGIDYYAVLGLNRDCNDADVSKLPDTTIMLESNDYFQANFVLLLVIFFLLSQFFIREESVRNFRRHSLRFHPERSANQQENDDNDDVVDEKAALRKAAFAVVAEAYEVLSDPLRRAVYEQFGEEGLKKGVCGSDGKIAPYVFHGQPLKTYREFFGTENPYADLLDNNVNPLPLDDCPKIKKKDDPLIKPLPLTLQEVYHGGVKKMKIQHRILGEEAKCTRLEEKILSVRIMPGMPSGAKIVFPEEGDQTPSRIPADIVFVTEDLPHEKFKRDGSNLKMTVDIFLSEALTGTIVTVRTVDERLLRVPITSVISPDYVKTVPGEGLPLVEDPDIRGDLIINFNIEFPSYLPPSSKSYVQKAFEAQYDDNDEDEDENDDGIDQMRRIVLAGKTYMRADKLSQICAP